MISQAKTISLYSAPPARERNVHVEVGTVTVGQSQPVPAGTAVCAVEMSREVRGDGVVGRSRY
jgi:hypothetical protein